MATYGALKISAKSDITLSNWNTLVTELENIDKRIPDKFWQHVDLIIDNKAKASALHLRSDNDGNSFITNRNQFVNNGTTGNRNLFISSAGAIHLQTGNLTANHGDNRLVVAANGNVGIGQTAPKSPLHIKGNAGTLSLEGQDRAYIQFYPQGYSKGRKAWLGFYTAGKPDLSLRNQMGGYLALGTSNRDQLIIDKSGKVGIGTATPHTKLQVMGDITLGGTGNNERFRIHSRSNSTGEFLEIAADKPDGKWAWGRGLAMRRNGNVGIGTNNPTEKLHVKGTVYGVHLKASSDLAVGRNAWVDGHLTCNVLRGISEKHNGGILAGRTGHKISFEWKDHLFFIYVDDTLVKTIRPWGVTG